MNTKFQMQITITNYNGGTHTTTKNITLNDLNRFANLALIINKNSGGQVWNWFGEGNGLPSTWDGRNFVLDTWKVCDLMNRNFGYKVEDINLIKEFFLRFTPKGADRIELVKFFKVEEIEFN